MILDEVLKFKITFPDRGRKQQDIQAVRSARTLFKITFPDRGRKRSYTPSNFLLHSNLKSHSPTGDGNKAMQPFHF